MQKIFHAGLACAPDNPKTTNRVPHWLLQHLGQCTLKPEEPPKPNRFQTGRLGRFGVKCRLFGGERGWRAHQRPTNASQSQPGYGCENVLLRVVPRLNPRRANQCTLKPEEPLYFNDAYLDRKILF
ncbi:hypothetical protein BT095_09210 [Corynebacterium diphtheriae]|nr:hypothetical protein BT095_09210 [Corynebacterium diphtheriae]